MIIFNMHNITIKLFLMLTGPTLTHSYNLIKKVFFKYSLTHISGNIAQYHRLYRRGKNKEFVVCNISCVRKNKGILKKGKMSV